jgi:BASS family bile acid:Na+ symporter
MASPNALDSVQLNFSPDNLLGLNIALAIIMYGVALELKWEDFQYIAKNPKGFVIGIISQFFVLPFLTWVLIILLNPPPSIALGMFLVAACPGGNVSNFLTSLAKGNIALSVSLTAVSSVAAIFLTPFNFSFWAGNYPPTAQLLQEVRLETLDVFLTIGLILGIPLLLGILTTSKFPELAKKLAKGIKPLSLVIFGALVLLALLGNYELFIVYIGAIFLWVLGHNFVGLASGFLTAKLARLPMKDVKTITIETGIQNSGLGLVLIFSFFSGLGGMALITAWWGIWHLISGIILASIWKKRP